MALARRTTPPRRTESPAASRAAVTFTPAGGAAERLYLDAEEGPWEPRQWQVAAQVLREARDITRAADADLVVLQEATSPQAVQRIADASGMAQFASRAGQSLGFLGRIREELSR